MDVSYKGALMRKSFFLVQSCVLCFPKKKVFYKQGPVNFLAKLTNMYNNSYISAKLSTEKDKRSGTCKISLTIDMSIKKCTVHHLIVASKKDILEGQKRPLPYMVQ